MAQRVPGGWDSPADRPSILEITVESTSSPRASVRREHLLAAIAVLGVVAGVVVIAMLPGGGGGRGSAPPSSSTRPAPTPAQPTLLADGGPPSAAVTGPYLVRGCMGSPVIGTQRGATAPCWRHRPYVTAVLRPVGTHWRGTLVPRSTRCSRVPLPPLARGKVKACRR